MSLGPAAAGTAVLPHIASMMAKGDIQRAHRTLFRFAGVMVAISGIAVGVLITASEPVMRLLVGNEAFDLAGMRLLASIQSLSLLQVPISVLLAIGIRLTAAASADGILYRLAALTIVLTLTLDLLLVSWFGLIGIPLAGTGVRSVTILYLFCKINGLYRRQVAAAGAGGVT
jgi:peptidoglycan biosynthesis protein MviN/MurJ (putative lipid II flippase)